MNSSTPNYLSMPSLCLFGNIQCSERDTNIQSITVLLWESIFVSHLIFLLDNKLPSTISEKLSFSNSSGLLLWSLQSRFTGHQCLFRLPPLCYPMSQCPRIGDTKGKFHAKIGTIKDKNGKDLKEAEEIKKRWQEYLEELYKKSS